MMTEAYLIYSMGAFSARHIYVYICQHANQVQ